MALNICLYTTRTHTSHCPPNTHIHTHIDFELNYYKGYLLNCLRIGRVDSSLFFRKRPFLKMFLMQTCALQSWWIGWIPVRIPLSICQERKCVREKERTLSIVSIGEVMLNLEIGLRLITAALFLTFWFYIRCKSHVIDFYTHLHSHIQTHTHTNNVPTHF